MDWNRIIRKLAPCGRDCSRCASYQHGEIQDLAERLIEILGNYQVVANMRQEGEPIFAKYKDFHVVLQHFAAASCTGCRSDSVDCPFDCEARQCHKDKGVDFCYECALFPCGEETGTEGKTVVVRERWLANNRRMQEIGLEAFYDEQLEKPRYP